MKMIKEGITAYKFAKTFRKYKNAPTEQEKTKAAKLLTKIFEQEGGIFLKIAQYLGTQKEQAEQIQKLSLRQDPVIAKDLFIEILQTTLEQTLNKNFDEVFVKIEDQAFSASIGQVQKGVLVGGEQVAIKVQYPQIKKTLTQQLKLLNLIPSGMPEKKWGVDIEQYKQMIKKLLDDEVDYLHEKELMEKSALVFNQYDFIKVPKIYPSYCTNNLLVSEFVEGLSVEEVLNLSHSDKKKITENLIKTLLVMIKHRYFQADSNHGNFLFTIKPAQIALLDFGQVRQLTPQFSKSLLALIYNLAIGKSVDFGAYFVALGFAEKKLIKIQSSLEVLAKIVFEPFTKSYPYDLSQWRYKEKIDLCLGEDKWWFRSAGGEEFFLVMKSFMGIKNLIDKLEIHLNWKEILLSQISEAEIISYTPAPVRYLRPVQQGMGEAVSVLIKENGQEKVRLKLQLNILYNFKENIGEDLVDKLQSQGINVEKIAIEALRSGAKPGVLFEFKDEDRNKEYLVKII